MRRVHAGRPLRRLAHRDEQHDTATAVRAGNLRRHRRRLHELPPTRSAASRGGHPGGLGRRRRRCAQCRRASDLRFAGRPPRSPPSSRPPRCGRSGLRHLRAPSMRSRGEASPSRTPPSTPAWRPSPYIQWPDLAAGLAGDSGASTRGPVVILTCDPAELHRSWLDVYVARGQIAVAGTGAIRQWPRSVAALGGTAEVRPVPIPLDCADGFSEAYYGRPERLPARHRARGWRTPRPGFSSIRPRTALRGKARPRSGKTEAGTRSGAI